MKKSSGIIIFILLQSLLYARVNPGEVHDRGFRMSFGPTIGFYSIYTQHAQSPTGKMSALIGFKKEMPFDKSHKTFFLAGLDYFFHGVNFRSYYFDQDTLQLYDKSFLYNYSVFIHELQVPLMMKFSFSRENNFLFSPYVMLGYHLRCLLPANVKVTQNGNMRVDETADVTFRNKMINEKINSCLSIVFGWQKNTFGNSRSGFFVELGYRYQFSQYYLHTKYTPSSLYFNSSHLVMQIGIKF